MQKSESPDKPKGTRTGYTTGACATACARAGVLALARGAALEEVTITLPQGQRVPFRLVRCELSADSALCGVIKDGGDDPDVTHGHEIQARVRLTGEAGQVKLEGGVGVGRVTKPGLGLELGGPAINPVPRRMIVEHCLGALKEAGLEARGAEVEVRVPQGAVIALKTLNARLGILGGISILGRSGIVHPYSHAAFIASIQQGVDVALAQGAEAVALTTGGQTEEFLRSLRPDLPEAALVQMGDFVGKALDHCRLRGVARVILASQVGKATKLAQGMLHTHAGRGAVDLGLLEGLALEAGAPSEEATALGRANTARHAFELSAGKPWQAAWLKALARRSAEVAWQHGQGAFAVESLLFDFEGGLLAEALIPRT